MRHRLQTHEQSWNEHKSGHGVRTGPETNNDCAGEGQQRFTEFDWMESSDIMATYSAYHVL
jgi:hypothetical protein